MEGEGEGEEAWSDTSSGLVVKKDDVPPYSYIQVDIILLACIIYASQTIRDASASLFTSTE